VGYALGCLRWRKGFGDEGFGRRILRSRTDRINKGCAITCHFFFSLCDNIFSIIFFLIRYLPDWL